MKLLIAVLVLMLLFPPFVDISDGSAFGVGYSFLLLPPGGVSNGATINVYTLSIHYLFVLTIGGLALLLTEQDSQAAGEAQE